MVKSRRAMRQSSLETYLRCGLRYRYEVLDGLPRRVTKAMAVGTGVHGGAREDLEAQRVAGKPETPSRIRDAAVSAYDTELARSDHDMKPNEVGSGRDTTAAAALVYSTHVSPYYQVQRVVAAEQKIEADFGDGIVIEGTLDAVTNWGVGDHKTGRPWSQAAVDSSRQLSIYALLHEKEYGALPRRVWIRSLVERKGVWVLHETQESFRSEAQLKAVLHIVEIAIEGIEEGLFLPAPEGAWWCSAKWCPHHRYCPAFAGKQEDEDE